jgi:hypothetical protein
MAQQPLPAGPAGLGPQGVTDEDRRFAGSRFSEVRDALFAKPYYSVWGAAGEAPLPVHPGTLRNVARGLLPLGRPWGLLQAAARTVDSEAELRWGSDGKGFRRLLHPSGVCLTGRWEVTEPTPYTGYFRQGSRGLLIARYSTCCTETRRGHSRSLALVARLYPTTDPGHAEPLRAASIITQEDLGGERTDFINDAELRSAPDNHTWRRGAGLPILLLTGLALMRADRQPSIRQLYEVAELGTPFGEPTRSPEFFRLVVDEHQPRIEGAGLDFRDEVLGQIYDRGDPAPKRELVFHVEVSDEGTTRNLRLVETRDIRNWRRIGRMVFTEAAASYNGDFVFHVHHPTWRHDRNDPATAVRVGGRKVR